MKVANFLLLSLCFIFVSCNKKEPTLTPVPEITPTNVTPPAPTPTPKLKHNHVATFYSTELNAKFTVEFRAHFNESSPNGYVIIDQFTIGDREYKVNTYGVGDDEFYIANIHGSEKFEINGASMWSSPKLIEYFRTAEAVAATWYAMDFVDEITIAEDSVAKTGREMLGRKYGLPAKVKLRK
jgi:hypothetical protein